MMNVWPLLGPERPYDISIWVFMGLYIYWWIVRIWEYTQFLCEIWSCQNCELGVVVTLVVRILLAMLIPPSKEPIKDFTFKFMIKLYEPWMAKGLILIKENLRPWFQIIMIIEITIVFWELLEFRNMGSPLRHKDNLFYK